MTHLASTGGSANGSVVAAVAWMAARAHAITRDWRGRINAIDQGDFRFNWGHVNFAGKLGKVLEGKPSVAIWRSPVVGGGGADGAAVRSFTHAEGYIAGSRRDVSLGEARSSLTATDGRQSVIRRIVASADSSPLRCGMERGWRGPQVCVVFKFATRRRRSSTGGVAAT